MKNIYLWPQLFSLIIYTFCAEVVIAQTYKNVVFLAGEDSHGKGLHEHYAGSVLLAEALNDSDLGVTARVVADGVWPVDLQSPDAIVMYCDGYKNHMAADYTDEIQALVDDGVGVACLHFAVEVEPEALGATFLEWIGGYFEIAWSVNPIWEAEFDELPRHPITRGVAPFGIRDEWYYHMRFQPEMLGVTPILSALPPIRTLTSRSKDQKRGSNPTVMAEVAAGKKQVLAWAYERPNGGRGFGFTGGHYHRNWQHDDFRKTVLNAIVWIAHGEVPASGVISRRPADREMNID